MNIRDVSLRIGEAKVHLTTGDRLLESAAERRTHLVSVLGALVETLQGLSPTSMRTDAEEIGTDLAGAGEAYGQGRAFLIEAGRGSDHHLITDAVTYAGHAQRAITGEETGATAEVPELVEQLGEFAGAVDTLLMTARGLETTLLMLEPVIGRAQGLGGQATQFAEMYHEGLGAAE